MVINIASSHRFHLLDLARELEKQGHKVRFYSYVPSKRAKLFGLKNECSYSLYFLVFPLLGLAKITNGRLFITQLIYNLLDNYLAFFMKPCDVYIALGTVYKKSIVYAKKKHNAITILEWGSKHVEEQQRILTEIKQLRISSDFFIKRVLLDYKLADYIAIPSDHVKQSFIERGIVDSKLLQNPYGVDLSMFKPTVLIQENPYDIIMVGGWSYRKGCDLIIEVCNKYKFKLLHVGSIVDLLFPKCENMTHIDAVNQPLLINYYAQARVFVLPSREEGLALVQAQALVCGLPIICSQHTGGRDLRNFLDDKKMIIEMEEFTIEELNKCIQQGILLSLTQSNERVCSQRINNEMSWEAYGIRYNENLIAISNKKTHVY